MPDSEDVLEALGMVTGTAQPQAQPQQEVYDPHGVSSKWFKWATLHGHEPQTCRCVGCRRWRMEPVPVKPRVKKARTRGYLWLSNDIDARLRRIALLKGQSISETARMAIVEFVESHEQKLGPQLLASVDLSSFANAE